VNKHDHRWQVVKYGESRSDENRSSLKVEEGEESWRRAARSNQFEQRPNAR
jgi:hypothetical protein